MGENDRITTKQRRFLAALAGARSVRDAAEAAGIGETTAWRYLRDEAVRAELAGQQSAMLQVATRGLAEDLAQARAVLMAVMGNEKASPSARVNAARAVLEHGLRYAELVSLDERITALERMAGDERTN
jgi:phage terminase small subunit